MALAIRMKRTGRRHRPCYRISVIDSRRPREGTVIESLGLYDPIAPREELRLELNVERAKYWVSQGARPSVTVDTIFRRLDVYADRPERKKRDRSGRKKVTATRRRREAAKEARRERKQGRRSERAAARAAAPAAAE